MITSSTRPSAIRPAPVNLDNSTTGETPVTSNAPSQPSEINVTVSGNSVESAVTQRIRESNGNLIVGSSRYQPENSTPSNIVDTNTIVPVYNILDSFYNTTYHIRWSITSDIIGSGISNSREFESIDKVIIAESGVTAGFNITDFEIENVCAPGPRVRSMLHTNFKMTIKEPYGLSLIDKVWEVSKQLNIRNHLTNTSFIELWFTGYNENGEIVTTSLKNSLYKLFRINISKVDVDSKSEGTEYRIEGIFDGMYGNADAIAVAPNGVNISGAKNVGEFFDNLATTLNIQQQNLEYDFDRRVEYKFNIPTWMRGWTFSRAPSSDQRNSSITVQNAGNNPTFSIARGMDVSTILYFIISMTEQGVRYVAGEDRVAGQASPSSSGRSRASISANGMANLFAIHSRSRLIGFDSLTNDYVREITYTITEYPTARAMIDSTNVAALQNPQQQRDRLATLLDSGRYKKVYDYIYTGKNLDILKLDLKFEWFWQALIPSHLGANHYSNITPGATVDQNSMASTLASRYRAARARRQTANDEIARVTSLLQSTGISNEERLAAQERLSAANTALRESTVEISNFGNTAVVFQDRWSTLSVGQQAEQALSSRSNAIPFGSTLNFSPSGTRRQQYLEDIVVTTTTARNPLNISFRPDPAPVGQATWVGGGGFTERASTNQGPGNLPRNRTLVAAVLNDVMSAPHFVNLDLEIRGDPYWLGIGNVDENQLIGTNSGNVDPNLLTSAWWYSGETGFILRFKTGSAPDENTGLMNLSGSENNSVAFNGVYIVTTVKSTFSNGRFTQSLKAIRDNLTVI